MKNEKYIHSLIIIAIVGVTAAAGFMFWQQLNPGTPAVNTKRASSGVTRFTSAQDFTAYLDRTAGMGSSVGLFPSSRDSLVLENVGAPTLGLGAEMGGPKLDRVSQTNVQVSGIDEPDIVKTDGTNIFLSSEQQFYYNFDDIIPLKGSAPADDRSITSTEPSSGSGTTGQATIEPSPAIIRPEPIQATTRVMKAVPPAGPVALPSIAASGTLLLDNKTLIVFSSQAMTGFDVTDPAAPKELWKATTPENTSLTSARLKQGKIFIVTQTYVNRNKPCPLAAITMNNREITMPCTEIYHSVDEAPADTTFTVMVVDPRTGEVERKVSLLGSAGSTVIAMFDQALYITYTVYADPVTTQYDFLTTSLNDLLPSDVRVKIQRLQAYDISRQAKLLEMETIISSWQNSLSTKEQEQLQKTISQRQEQYQKQRQRTFATTNIVKIQLSDLSVAATGAVPGHVLNQFAIDEHQQNVRVATTSTGWFFGGGESVNDVYVLGSDLKTRGSLLDLAPGEQIYSARFVGDTGYLVTFKQIDPFFVLDLSNPDQPKIAGQLKIPGFSSYLHPLTPTLVLGVGQEDFKTKLSLFDVSDPSAPAEVSKLLLDRGWTEVQSNHHAFLQDDKHKIVFIPAGTTGEVVSYDQNTLTTKKTVTDIQAQRAIYINDFLYVLSQEKMVVLNEQTWEQVGELVF